MSCEFIGFLYIRILGGWRDSVTGTRVAFGTQSDIQITTEVCLGRLDFSARSKHFRSKTMPVVIYTFDRSPVCRAVMLTVKAIGLKVDYKTIDLSAGEHKSEAYLKINPNGTVPFMDDNGLRIWESRAITGYLVDQYAKDDSLYPKNPKARAKVDNMLYFDSGSLASNISEYFYPQLFLGRPADQAREAVVHSKLQLLNQVLHQNKFAAGEQLTIADFSIISNLVSLQAIQFNFDPYPAITSWIDRVKAKVPFYDEVTKKGIDAIHQMARERLRH